MLYLQFYIQATYRTLLTCHFEKESEVLKCAV